MKCGTHARVFSQTLEHGNSNNEIRQETEEEGKERGVNMERSTAGTKKVRCRECNTLYSIARVNPLVVAAPRNNG